MRKKYERSQTSSRSRCRCRCRSRRYCGCLNLPHGSIGALFVCGTEK